MIRLYVDGRKTEDIEGMGPGREGGRGPAMHVKGDTGDRLQAGVNEALGRVKDMRRGLGCVAGSRGLENGNGDLRYSGDGHVHARCV